MGGLTKEQAIETAAENLCIAASLSRDDAGVLIGVHVFPDYAVLKVKELLSKIIKETIGETK